MADEADIAQPYVDAEERSSIARVQAAIPRGESARQCEGCGDPIPEPRRQAYPGTQHCIACAEALERQGQGFRR